MGKAIKMTDKETKLYQELKKLSKRANQRILRLERFMGKEDTWAVKNLKAQLEQEKLQAWTQTVKSSGRVRVAKRNE